VNNETDTIVAIATAPGASAIAVVRISGSASLAIADALVARHSRTTSQQPANTFFHGKLRIGRNTPTRQPSYIDDVIVMVFKAPHSYTGDDVVEIQCHGGTWTTQAILRAILEQGARMAEPGEFTRRAFMHGKMDLVQAEAVIDLINAKTERAANAAIEQMDGVLSTEFAGLYEELLSISADLEMALDFDENAMPNKYKELVNNKMSIICDRIVTLINTWDDGRLIREGALVVICGATNVGKSTLMNQILGFRRAIVTDVPGTTRDSIEEMVVIQGFPCRLVDTAGVRETTCQIEQEGIERTRRYLNRADLVLYVCDGSQAIREEDRTLISSIPPARLIYIVNKCDLGLHDDHLNNDYLVTKMFCSFSTENVLDKLGSAIIDKLSHQEHSIHGAYISERHRDLLVISKKEIDTILNGFNFTDDQWIVLAASNVRHAATIIGEILGKTYYNDMLDRVFSRFCVGK